MRRVRAVASHLAAAVVEDEVLPLSAEAEAAFTRDGFCALQLTELPPEFHESFGEQMRELSENPPPAEQGWLSLEGQLLQVLRTPTFKGALQSILGNDFQMAAPWANRADQGGMIGLHITAGGGHDQQYHKVSRPYAHCAPCSAISLRLTNTSAQDGTDHGNTQSTVRDLRQRQCIMMYYPLGASLEMGP